MAEDNADDKDSRDTAGPPRVPDRRAAGGPSRYLRPGDTPVKLAGRVLRSRWRALTDRFSRDLLRRALRIRVAEAPSRPEWSGDRARDVYELELLHEFVEAGKPVLGICRANLPEALAHVHDDYDAHRHAIVFPPGSSLSRISPIRSGRPSIRSTTRPSRTSGAISWSRPGPTRTAWSRRSATSAHPL